MYASDALLRPTAYIQFNSDVEQHGHQLLGPGEYESRYSICSGTSHHLVLYRGSAVASSGFFAVYEQIIQTEP